MSQLFVMNRGLSCDPNLETAQDRRPVITYISLLCFHTFKFAVRNEEKTILKEDFWWQMEEIAVTWLCCDIYVS
jgi:hypothetical protein